MKILLVTEFLSDLTQPVFSGGVETRAFYTAKHLAQSHQVVVFCRRRKGEKAQEKQGKLVIRRFGSPVNDSIATIPSLWTRAFFIVQCLLKSWKVKTDIVEGSNFVTLLPAFLIGWRKRIPKIAWYPDVLLGDWQRYFGPILGLVGSVAERFLLTLPWDQIITISEPVAQKLTQRRIEKNKITVVPCGIEPSQFRKRYKKFSQPTLCVVSRLLPYKRVKDAVVAVELLKSEIPELRLVIIGEGPCEQELRKQITRLSLQKRVILKKRVSQEKLIRLLARSHLLVHPSLVEGFGIVLVEAAAAGTPFVAADTPALKELAEQLQSGIMVKRRNSKRVAEAVARLMLDRKLYGEKQKNGLRNVRQFTWDRAGRQTEKVYQDLVRDGP